VGLIQDIENSLLNQLAKLFKPVLDPLKRLWDILKRSFDAIVNLIPETIQLIQLVYSEVLEWKNFREEINFKSGVINLQSVRDKILDLVDEMVAAYRALVDIFTGGFKQATVKPFEDAADAAAELAEVIEGFGKVGLKDFVTKFGAKLEKAGGKILEVLAIIEVVCESLLKVVRELNTIVTAVKDARETFETGEGLFLPQTNPRKKLDLVGGGSIKIRVGNLH
jgi:hypothetical protein